MAEGSDGQRESARLRYERRGDPWAWTEMTPCPVIRIDVPLAGPIPAGVDFIHTGLNRAQRRRREKEARRT